MVTNFVGIQRDFSVVAGVKADVGIRVVDADGKPVDVGLCTWTFGIWKDGNAAKATHWGLLLDKPAGAQVSDLFWRLPVLEAGLWRYELTARGSDGEVSRVFYGVIGSREASDIVKDGARIGVQGWRMLEVQLPAVAGGKLVARWMSGDYVLALCEVARKHAETAERVQGEIEAVLDEAVEEATERAEAAAVQAAESAASAKADAASAKADRQAIEVKFQETDAFIDGFYDVALRVIVPNQTTGTWWIGGRDSKQPFQGEQGYSPQISTSGYWLVWRDGQVVESDTRARAEDGFSPYVDSAGYWVYVDPLTGQVGRGPIAAGKDGLDGTAVRRILVNSYDEIPQEGETCHGGVYYYVRDDSENDGESVDVHFVRWGDWSLYFVHDGEVVYLDNGHGTSADSLVQTINAGGYPFTAEKLDERTVRLHPTSGGVSVEVVYGCRLAAGGAYVVYAWLEQGGTGGWVRVGLANDLATAEVHGLVKLGTNSPVVFGAPVGNDSNGKMRVSAASYTEYGVVKPSNSSINSNGGKISMSSDGMLFADRATTREKGVVQLSCGETIPDDDDNIGLRADGKIGVRRATLDEFGSVRLGSELQQVAKIPYLLSVGSITDADREADNGKLANNLLLGGALQHRIASEWTSGGRLDIDGIDSANLKSNVYYLGMFTSSSFKQSEEKGLELNPATTTLLGGVKKQTTLASGGDVPTGSAVLNYLNSYYYTKGNLYTKDELTDDGGVIETVLSTKLLPIYAPRELEPYAKKADIEKLYAPASLSGTVSALSNTVSNNKVACESGLEAVKALVRAMESKLNGYVRTGDSGIEEISKVAYDDFAKLEVLDENMLYLVTEG